MGIDTALRIILREVVREEVRAAVRDELKEAPGPSELSASKQGEYISIARAAEIAGVRPATVRSWIEQGRLPCRRAGRLLRVRTEELEAFLAGGADAARSNAVDIDKRAAEILSRRWATSKG